MGSKLLVKADELQAKGRDFTALANRMKTLELQLAKGLESEGECWGKDEVGGSFSGPYGTKVGMQFSNATYHADHLDFLGKQVDAIAVNFKATEGLNAGQFKG